MHLAQSKWTKFLKDEDNNLCYFAWLKTTLAVNALCISIPTDFEKESTIPTLTHLFTPRSLLTAPTDSIILQNLKQYIPYHPILLRHDIFTEHQLQDPLQHRILSLPLLPEDYTIMTPNEIISTNSQ
eukprot:Blabericola_migrator_1__9108@NODE_4868_length_951_cov_99_699095_g2441_i2_p1_GENE_NODE_4868_length_951_cov_99_699095_g2441_i2NODE_4868_length_951_cov_99_699095_g2441_i2_p1_ORF_typecomplete_len127_score5_36_NODE_4868_length_951_cov_99_699095_g2441_i2510890